ncbi:MAG: diguanylate cyclase [Piscirickettsiaceae bacterium]|nr:diguanylate cyclase [Piscirickettsiaceae bacterium]
MIPAIASATLGPLTLLASGMINTDLLPSVMWRWWKSDVLDIVFFTPLILVFVTKFPFFRNAVRRIEVAMLLASVGMGLAIMSTTERHTARKYKQHAKLFEISHDGVMITDEHTVNVSASVGISLCPEHGTDMESLMNNADMAMYQTKHAGRNNYAIAEIN